ncbi:hypothetical protein ACVNPZ_03330 [Staphylococcus aureus]
MARHFNENRLKHISMVLSISVNGRPIKLGFIPWLSKSIATTDGLTGL